MPSATKILKSSKPKFLLALQHPTVLWHAYHAKNKIPTPNAQTQAAFGQGHEVGDLAKHLFPEGIEVCQSASGPGGNHPALTKEDLNLRGQLFL